jgi:nucleoside-diphosphate-sugar epimerase
MDRSNRPVVIFGAAGLVGQNLVGLLERHHRLICVDKHKTNIAILRRLHPDVTVIEADMAEPGDWEDCVVGAEAAVMLQAQIGGEIETEFERNNIRSTERALAALRRAAVSYLVHVSSSVVKSAADDWYTRTKHAQEALVAKSGIAHCVLRPTLMFGPYDRKHLGWLSRFMQRAPVFPIPGHGRYLRQPLYALDFCRLIQASLERRITGAFDITGRERIDYIDIIRAIRDATGARTPIVKIPYWSFWTMLKIYGLARPNAPFTTKQLEALVTPDEFELIPWWDIFGVPSTPFAQAIAATFAPGAGPTDTLEF